MSDIDDLIARAMDALDGVTAGPWTLDPYEYWTRDRRDSYWDVDGPNGGWLAHVGEKPDAAFMAASRQLVPELVGHLQAVAGLLKATQEQLDPFSGSGTTGLAAQSVGRRYIGIDINPDCPQEGR